MTIPQLRIVMSIFAAVTFAPKAISAEAGEWYESGPGTIVQRMAKETGPDRSRARQITFDFAGDRPEYWCAAGIAYKKPIQANALSFYAKASDAHQVNFKLFDSNGAYGYYSAQVTDEWAQIEVRRESPLQIGDGDSLKDIVRLEFIFNNTQFSEKSPYRLLVTEVQFKTIAPAKLLYPNWMPAATPPPVPGYRIGTCLHTMWGEGNGEFFGFDKPGGYEVAVNVVDHLIEQYGNVEITVAQWLLAGEAGRKFSQYVNSKGGIIMAEGHHAGVELAPAINIHGQTGQQAGFPAYGLHSQDLTDPRLLRKIQQMHLASAEAGALGWRIVDYIWPYWGGGVWGYSPAAIKAWRSALNEADGGISIVAADEGEGASARDAHFWEYFESYQGYRMTPQDVGIRSWDQYLPPQADAPESPQLQNNRLLHNLLFHYWWVKFCGDAARDAAKYDSLSQPITNPESFANGTDLYWLLKSALVRGASVEWWSGAEVVLPTYYNGRYYDNAAKKNGRELILHGETAAAGGRPYGNSDGDQRRPHYWDNQANYLITYAQAASVDFKGKHDQYWGSRWEKMTDPSYPEYQSYTGFHSAWCAFLQCRNDGAAKPQADVLALTRRPITDGENPFDRDGSGAQRYNLARDLFELNYLHDGAAVPLDDAFEIEKYRTIFQCNAEPPRKLIEALAEWVSAEQDRALVLHSFVPTRFAAPAPAGAETPLLQAGGFEKTLGFDSIAQTKFRRGVVRTDDPAFAAALGKLNDSEARLSEAGLFQAAGESQVLVRFSDKPLVSQRQLGKGRVIYLHFVPEDTSPAGRKFQTAITDGVMRYLGYQPSGISETHRMLAFDRATGGKAFVAINPDARSTNVGIENYGVFQAQDPNVKAQALVRVGKPNAPCKFTDMITREQLTIVSDADGYIPICLDGWNMRGWYVDFE